MSNTARYLWLNKPILYYKWNDDYFGRLALATLLPFKHS